MVSSGRRAATLPASRWAVPCVEAALLVSAGWTLAYHCTLWARWPAGWTPGFAVAIVGAACPLVGRGWIGRGPLSRWPGGTGLGLLALAVLTALSTLVASRPDDDDVSFFHRALVQLQHLRSPFALTDTLLDEPGLPALSVLHVLTSHEPGWALAAHLTGADPVWLYQHGPALVGAFLLPLALFILARRLRVPPPAAAGVTALSIAFLCLDAGTHRAFGNMALVRLWQGKGLLVSLLLPLASWAALRFLGSPTKRNWAVVAMAGVAAVGLSNSGVFLFPSALLLLALAYCLAFGATRRRLMKSAALLLGAGYPAAVALAVLGDWLPMPRDDAVWRAGWPPVWRESLALVLGGAGAMARDAFLLLVVPAVLLPRPLRRLLLAWSACFVLVFANELLGARWVSLLRPGAYWRLAYLLPLPLCAGLPALSLVRDKAGRRLGTAPRLVGLLAILVTAATCQHTVFSPRNRTAWKRPGELRFTPAEAEFARLAAPFVSGRVVLAPEPVTVVLALRAPGARFYLGRFADTLHALRNVDRGDDAFRRLTARQFLDDLQPSPEREVALARAVSRGVDALVVPDRPDALRAFLIRLPGGGWGQVVSGGGYRLLLRAGTPGRMVD